MPFFVTPEPLHKAVEPYHPEYANTHVQGALEVTEARLARDLNTWFGDLLYELTRDDDVKKVAPGQVLAMLDNVIWWSQWSERLRSLLEQGSLAAAQKGQTTVERQLKLNLSWDYLQPAVTAWASQNAAQLVTAIEQDLKAKLKAQIVGGLSDGKSLYQIRDEIGALQNDENQALFSQARAGLIARTEVIRAHSQGAAIGYEKSGVVRGMKWLDGQSGACPKCHALHNKIVPLGQVFYSDPHFGDGLPPRHPNCRCAVAPVTIDQAKDLPADSPLRDNWRSSIAELTDTETATKINGVEVTGNQRWHYIRRHFTAYADNPPQIKDLPRAETMLEQVLQGQYDGAVEHRGALVYYREWSPRSYLVVPVKNGQVKSLYIKEKRQVEKWITP